MPTYPSPQENAAAGAPPGPAAADVPPERKRSVVRVLLRLWPYVRPVRARLFTAAGVAIVASCLSLVFPLVLKWIVDGPVAGRDPGGVWLGALVLLLLGIAEGLLFGFRRWLVARPLAGVEASMRADIYHRLQRVPLAFHDRWPSGQLLSRGTGDLNLIRIFLSFPLTFLLVNGVTILVGLGILLVQEWTLGLLLMLPFLPMIVICSFFEARYSLASRRAQDQAGDLATIVEESVLGIRVVKGFGRHRSQERSFHGLAGQLRGTELLKARMVGSIWAAITVIPETAVGAALVIGTVQVADGELSAGTLVAFLSTALALRWPVESMGFLLALCQEAATATERYFEVLDEPEESGAGAGPGRRSGARSGSGPVAGAGSAPGSESGAGAGVRSGATDPAEGPGNAPAAPAGLRFTGVAFRYPDAPASAAPVLDGVDLHIRPGETMALVGATGSGKTTLTALVPRLHELTAGRITVDGRDITEMPRERLRALVSVAFEEPTLFSATVAENVLMGTGGTDSRGTGGTAADGPEPGPPGALDRALGIAQADFVPSLPRGADTEVGEQGLTLSGGQRQRLALARAVAARPRFLVLDDPLSALDVHTEARVEAALRHVLKDTTALVVAHRPSTVMLADRVALLSGGRIAAVGTHHELLRTSAEYAWLMSGAERTPAPRAGAEASVRPARSAADRGKQPEPMEGTCP
ncbi:ABC transporter ATP-binding protein [Streptomyces sp. NPDC003691]